MGNNQAPPSSTNQPNSNQSRTTGSVAATATPPPSENQPTNVVVQREESKPPSTPLTDNETLPAKGIKSSASTTSFEAPNLYGASAILVGDSGKSLAQQLRTCLPVEQKLHNDWNMLYSNKRNGASIATFAEIVMHHGPMLIIIQDMEGNIFGAFTSVSLEKKPTFYGNTGCFLFKIVNSEESDEKIVKAFPSSGRNDNYVYFNYGNKYNPYNGLAFGGKLGCFSLCVEEDWRFGKTVGDLMTYSYSPQLSSDSDFEIQTIEAWIFPLSESIQIDLRYRSKAKQSKQALGEENATEIFLMKQAGIMSSENDHIRETAYQKDKTEEKEN